MGTWYCRVLHLKNLQYHESHYLLNYFAALSSENLLSTFAVFFHLPRGVYLNIANCHS
jgi:hypothetical protein